MHTVTVSLERSLCVSMQGILQSPHWILSREEEGECEGVVRGGEKGLCVSDSDTSTVYQCPFSTYHMLAVCVHYSTCVSVTAVMSCSK